MYDGILHKPLFLPPGKSEAIRSLLVGLLQKDPHRRLGSIADFVSNFHRKKKSFHFSLNKCALVQITYTKEIQSKCK